MVSTKVFAAALLCAAVLCVSLPGSCEATGLWEHEHNWQWQHNGPWAEWWAQRYAKWAKFLEEKQKLAELKKPAKKVIVVEEVPAKVVVEKVPEVVKVVESPTPAPKPVVAEVPASPAAPTPVISAAPAATPVEGTTATTAATAAAAASPAPAPTTTEAVSAANATAAPAAAGCTTVAAAAAATPELSTLLTAVKAAGLDTTLADPNLVATIFAPTNDAFAKLLAALGLTAETVTAPENLPVLKTLLTYHVVPGVAAKSTDLTNGQTLPTLNDAQTLTVDLSTPGTVKIKPSLGDAATVLTPDVEACKAIVHVIDTVLLPSNALPGTAATGTTAPTATTAPAGAAATTTPAGAATTTVATAPATETAPAATLLPAGAALTSTGI